MLLRRIMIFLSLLFCIMLIGCNDSDSSMAVKSQATSSYTAMSQNVTTSIVGIETEPIVTLTGEEAGFQYVCSGMYDIDSLYEYKNIQAGTEYTYWEYVFIDTIKDLRENAGLTLTSELFSEKNYIIVYGRKIADIEFKSTTRYGAKRYIAIVTYAEKYDGAVVYVYEFALTERLALESPCYIMKGEERIFYVDGKTEANQYE